MCKLFSRPTPIIPPQEPYVPTYGFEEKEKFAFLCGINKYAPRLNADLRGCANDVETYRYVLINYYGIGDCERLMQSVGVADSDDFHNKKRMLNSASS